MSARRYLIRILICCALISANIFGCVGSSTPPPKKTVLALFGAMQDNDQAALTHLLDLPELMRSMNEDYALQTDSPRVFHSPQEVLDDLTGDGRTKASWFSLQRIVSKTEMTSETTATVDVTFVDKERSQGYLTKFGLHLANGKWKVYSFKTVRSH